MNIQYFHRNKDLGFSLYKVFDSIKDEIKEYVDIEEHFLRRKKAQPFDILVNGVHAFLLQNNSHLKHITGDVHYLTYFLPRKRTIVTVHDVGLIDILKGPKRWLWKHMYIYSLRRAEKVIFVSEYTANEVLKHVKLRQDQIKIIPNSVSRDFKSNLKTFNSQKPTILHIGTGANKNLNRTINALKGIPCHLRIIGPINKETRDMLAEASISYSNGTNLTDVEILNEYIACDIVNFPSTFEGFGMPILEGQAVGRVVVTSNIPPMTNVAGGGAYYVNPFDISSIRNAYLEIINDTIRREQLIHLGNINVTKYQQNVIAAEHIKLYKDIS